MIQYYLRCHRDERRTKNCFIMLVEQRKLEKIPVCSKNSVSGASMVYIARGDLENEVPSGRKVTNFAAKSTNRPDTLKFCSSSLPKLIQTSSKQFTGDNSETELETVSWCLINRHLIKMRFYRGGFQMFRVVFVRTNREYLA